MPLTMNANATIATHIRAYPAFAQALLEEAAALYLKGETNTAKSMLHTLVSATVGYEHLATQVARPQRCLQRMLSRSGRLTMRNLAAIFQTLTDSQHIAPR